MKPSQVERIREAVALAYSQTEQAPRIVAKGRGLIAEQIMAKAKEHGVYVHESQALVALLSEVDLDQHIPASLYRAVAELLAWLYRLEHGDTTQPSPIFTDLPDAKT